jgi:hypothetical protein
MILNLDGLTLTGLAATDETTVTTLPIATTAYSNRTVLRVPILVAAGDVLDITAQMQITNDTGKVIGTGLHLLVYDVDIVPVIPVADRPWTEIAPLTADNCPPDRHHMPLATSAIWPVPADWPADHRAMVVLQAAAFRSSTPGGETVRVDQGYDLLTVRRYTPTT